VSLRRWSFRPAVGPEADAARRSNWRGHQLANCVEHQASNSHERAHDLNASLDSNLAVEDARQHDRSMLGKNERQTSTIAVLST
jgi:hypothetical protein